MLFICVATLLLSAGVHGLLPECVNSNVTCHIARPHIKAILIGDTGGAKGRATDLQKRLAVSMARLVRKEGLDFVINVGDNIYKNGADSPNDKRFQTVFEKPYSAPEFSVPWYMIAGNHDHGGNVYHQVAYAPKSKKWVMPNLFYKASYSFGVNTTTTVDLVFVDTMVMCGIDVDRDGNVKLEAVPNRVVAKFVSLDQQQQTWIEKTLNESTADYLIVSGHYPTYTTNGGLSKCLAEKLDPMLHKYNVTAYIAGHHHSLQYFTPRNKSGPRYVITGAGSRLGGNRKYIEQQTVNLAYRYTGDKLKSKGGFVALTIEETTARLDFYSRDLSLDHSDILRPRHLNTTSETSVSNVSVEDELTAVSNITAASNMTAVSKTAKLHRRSLTTVKPRRSTSAH